MEDEIEAFLINQVQICEEENGCLGMGLVRQVVPFHQATRGARLQIHIDVESELLGKLPSQLYFSCFGRTGDVTVGQRLLFAVGLNPGDAQSANFMGLVEVPPGMEEEVARIHERVLEQASKELSAGGKNAGMIEEQALRDCLAGGGSVALARVARLEPIYQETRGAKVIIHLEIEQQLYGKLPRQVNYWVYGGLDQVKLPPRLMVAVYPPYEGTEEVELIASVGVPEGLEAESIQAHQQELAKLGTSPAPSGR